MKTGSFFVAAALLGVCVAAPSVKAEAVIGDAGFESGSIAPEWSTFGPDFFGNDPPRFDNGFRISEGGDARTGRYGVVADVLTGDPATDFRGLQQTIDTDFSVGEIYTLSAYIRLVSADSSQSYLELAYLDTDGDVIGGTATSAPQTGDQPFTLVSTSPLVVPVGTETIRVQANILTGAAPNGDFHIFDDFAPPRRPSPSRRPRASGSSAWACWRVAAAECADQRLKGDS